MTVEIAQSWLKWKAEMDDQVTMTPEEIEWVKGRLEARKVKARMEEALKKQAMLNDPLADSIFTERELALIANCTRYATQNPSGLPGHNLMMIIAKFATCSTSLVKEVDEGRWYYYVPSHSISGVAMTKKDAMACVQMIQESNG